MELGRGHYDDDPASKIKLSLHHLSGGIDKAFFYDQPLMQQSPKQNRTLGCKTVFRCVASQ